MLSSSSSAVSRCASGLLPLSELLLLTCPLIPRPANRLSTSSRRLPPAPTLRPEADAEAAVFEPAADANRAPASAACCCSREAAEEPPASDSRRKRGDRLRACGAPAASAASEAEPAPPAAASPPGAGGAGPGAAALVRAALPAGAGLTRLPLVRTTAAAYSESCESAGRLWMVRASGLVLGEGEAEGVADGVAAGAAGAGEGAGAVASRASIMMTSCSSAVCAPVSHHRLRASVAVTPV